MFSLYDRKLYDILLVKFSHLLQYHLSTFIKFDVMMSTVAGLVTSSVMREIRRLLLNSGSICVILFVAIVILIP